MNRYTDGKRVINATEKMYLLLYKNQGFQPIESAKVSNKGNEENKIQKKSSRVRK